MEKNMKRFEELQDIREIKTKKGTISLPCMTPMIVPVSEVMANSYNPNHVSHNNMLLLLRSITDNGFCFPVVVIWDDEIEKFIVIDGFHRYLIFRDYLEADVIPVIVLDHDMAQRMAATVQFNRARGVHQVDLMGDLVQSLVQQGMEDEKIAKELGMELEEVLRLKQVTGIAELFKNHVYSRSWKVESAE